MATSVQESSLSPSVEGFLEKHFMGVAFAVSALVLFLLSPLSFLIGTVLGFGIHAYLEPKLKAAASLTVPHTLGALLGAIARILQFTPAGWGGGVVFRWIPFLGCCAIGSALYRATKF